MYETRGNLEAINPDRAAMIDYYTAMYPSLAQDCYPHVQAVAEEMDDAAGYPLVPPERFAAMVDRIMARMAGRDDAHGYVRSYEGYHHKRRRHCERDPLCALITALLIAELLKRRRCC